MLILVINYETQSGLLVSFHFPPTTIPIIGLKDKKKKGNTISIVYIKEVQRVAKHWSQ